MIKNHWLSAALFLLYWLVAYGLHVLRWNAPQDTGDMVRPVMELHFLPPVIAGALVSWWRRHTPGSITGGMLAGAAVLVIDVAAVLTHGFIAFDNGESGGSGESIFELPVLLTAVGLLGSLLGLIGAAGSTGLDRLLNRWQKPKAHLVSPGDALSEPPAGERGGAEGVPLDRAAGIVPRRMLRVATGLVFAVAAIVALGVIPAVRKDTFAGATPERAATAFAVNAVLNVLLGIALLAPVSRRSAGAGKVLTVMAGFVGLLLGSALLDAASAFAGHGPGMRGVAVTCFACATGDLGAGVLALIAALRRHRHIGGAALC